MKKPIQGAVIALSAAALFTAGNALAGSHGDGKAAGGDDAKVSCTGVNECSGKGECAAKGNECAGKNKCKGEGVQKMSAEDCAAKGGKVAADG